MWKWETGNVLLLYDTENKGKICVQIQYRYLVIVKVYNLEHVYIKHKLFKHVVWVAQYVLLSSEKISKQGAQFADVDLSNLFSV